MTVGDLCTREVVVTDGDLPIQDAARLMRDRHVGNVVLVERRPDGSAVPKGVITDRDLVVGVLALDLEHIAGLKVRDMVTAPVVTSKADVSLAEAIATMTANGVRRLPVVDSSGALVGILTADDVYEALAEQLSLVASVATYQQRRERRSRK
ncbi:MAG: CBS domain-containing protein [Deltaproteobacteria bacterium]|nr:CBS domain-containing protein [Deltaproteobacteria bacterium]